ncbi:MAG: DUF202 domain-containing protein, partial [Micromonosporaceae bacterium]
GQRTSPPAAQPERTRFAWRRTVLTATVVALLALRQALLAPSAAARVFAAAVMLLWLVVLIAGHRRVVALGREEWAETGEAAAVRRLPGRAPALLAAATCGLALVGIGLLAAE